jgi:hypothetical protein
MKGPVSTVIHPVHDSAPARAPAHAFGAGTRPAQPTGGGVGRGGYPRHTRAAAWGVGVGAPPSETK